MIIRKEIEDFYDKAETISEYYLLKEIFELVEYGMSFEEACRYKFDVVSRKRAEMYKNNS